MNCRWLLLLLAAAAACQPQRLRIGEIEFFGYAGLDLEALRRAVPVNEGDELTEAEMPQVTAKLKQVLHATSVAATCCDESGGLMLYIGLPGKSARALPYRPVPRGTDRLPPAVTNLYQQFLNALARAIEKGASAEDDAQGYALFVDPEVRAKQLSMRDYAVRHARLVRRVLSSASDAEQRAAAAHLLGYVPASTRQIAALVRASRDSDDDVRNNAVRALAVQAKANSKMAASIPAAEFLPMLYSNSWQDRNKAAFLQEALTQRRDPKLLAQIRAQALDPLLEMARWRSAGHAYTARVLLGRCAGIEESRLQQIISTGQLTPILEALQAR